MDSTPSGITDRLKGNVWSDFNLECKSFMIRDLQPRALAPIPIKTIFLVFLATESSIRVSSTYFDTVNVSCISIVQSTTLPLATSSGA